MFERVFEPITIGKLKLKNRVFLAPTQSYTSTPDGYPTALTRHVFEERCRGGWGLVAGEATSIRQDGKPFHGFSSLHHDDHMRALSMVAEIMHKYDLPACIQLVHAGRSAQKVITGMTPLAPSAPLPEGGVVDWPPDGSNKPKAMTDQEVEELINDFVTAVLRAKKAGFDMVLLHGAHGFIFGAFQAHYTNHRTDKWGEPTAFTVEVIRRAREAVGPDFALGLRLNGDDFFPGGVTLEQNQRMIPKFVEAGLDWIDVSAGARERNFWVVQPLYMPRGCLVHLAEGIKKVSTVPVVVAGRINDPRVIEHILNTNRADAVAVSRAQHADPDFLNKTRDGRLDDIRRCMACDLCMGKKVSLVVEIPKCAVNYDMGRDAAETGITPATTAKTILVVGGGVAGMEFARVAHLRGHSVTLCEKESHLGGAVRRTASKIPKLNTRDLMNSVKYLSVQLEKQGNRILLGQNVTPVFVEEMNPDVVVLATGSTPVKPTLPGVDGRNVLLLDDYLHDPSQAGHRVVVLGGGQGWETAVSLAREGKETTLVEETDTLGDAPYITRGRRPALEFFGREAGVNIMTGVKVHEISEYGVVITNKSGSARLIPADTVIVALQRAPNNSLQSELQGLAREIYSIGDCVEPKHTMEAIHSGSRLARQI